VEELWLVLSVSHLNNHLLMERQGVMISHGFLELKNREELMQMASLRKIHSFTVFILTE